MSNTDMHDACTTNLVQNCVKKMRRALFDLGMSVFGFGMRFEGHRTVHSSNRLNSNSWRMNSLTLNLPCTQWHLDLEWLPT